MDTSLIKNKTTTETLKFPFTETQKAKQSCIDFKILLDK